MMHNHALHTHAAPAREYSVLAVSMLLSLPTLLGLFVLSVLAGYHFLTGNSTDLRVLHLILQWPLTPAFLLLYVVFGPMISLVLCTVQRARIQGASERAQAPRAPLSRMNRAALSIAALALALVIVLVALGMVVRGGT